MDAAVNPIDINLWRESQFVHLQHRGQRHVRVRTQVFAKAVDDGLVKLLESSGRKPTYRAIRTEGVTLDKFMSKRWEQFYLVDAEFTGQRPQVSSWDRLSDPII